MCDVHETTAPSGAPGTGNAYPAGGRRRRRPAVFCAAVLTVGVALAGCARSGAVALHGVVTETTDRAAAAPLSTSSSTSPPISTQPAPPTTGGRSPSTTTSTRRNPPVTVTTRPAAPTAPAPARSNYPVHTVTATTFWVGEPSDSDDFFISNVDSAWDDNWQEHYGGVDDPAHRDGWRPAAFTPGENPFYVALPYDDLDDNDQVKASAAAIPWAAERVAGQSVLKNRWVRIERAGKVAYAQWEDVGPLSDDDVGYVFGRAAPANQANDSAGIDVSPAVQDQLGLDGLGTVSWQFVDRADVPPGPWLTIVTTRGLAH
jgi:hypothetical protein